MPFRFSLQSVRVSKTNILLARSHSLPQSADIIRSLDGAAEPLVGIARVIALYIRLYEQSLRVPRASRKKRVVIAAILLYFDI